ncbi:MAG: inositol monophosphatase family protein, partial [Burkholderiales bacterium]
MHPMLNIAVKAARRAGALINRAALEGGLEVRAKNRNDFVTQVDK